MKSARRTRWSGGAAVLVLCATLIGATAQEDFNALVRRLQQEKPQFARRQQTMLAQRYDLNDRAAPGVTMSRGKPVQDGVRVRLAGGMTWDRLAALPTPSARPITT